MAAQTLQAFGTIDILVNTPALKGRPSWYRISPKNSGTA